VKKMTKDEDMRRERERRGLSQKDLAKELGLSRMVINRIENRDYSYCTIETVIKVRKYLGL